MRTNSAGLLRLLVVVALAAFAGAPAMAQGLSAASPAGVNAAFTRLFGDVKAFSASADVTVRDAQEKELASMPMTFHMNQTRIRMDVDMASVKSSDLPPGAAAGLKQIGMDKVYTLILPDTKYSYLVYPGLEAYLRNPLKEEDQIVSTTDFKLEREETGRETISGHPCVRYRVTITDARGRKQEATTWNATDLKDFPVQIQMSEGNNLMTLRFSGIKLAEPPSDLFVLPKGYTAHDSQESLMQAVMARAMRGLGGP